MSKPKAHLTMEDKDHGWEDIRKELQKAEGGAFAKVGYIGTPESERREDGPLGNVAIALVHEFGSPSSGIPERSHLRSSFDINRGKYEALLARLAKLLYVGKISMEKVVSLVGLQAANDVKTQIRTGNYTPNSRAVTRRKQALGRVKGGLVKALIDTWRMLQSIDYEAVIRGSQVIAQPEKPAETGVDAFKRMEARDARAKVGRIHKPSRLKAGKVHR